MSRVSGSNSVRALTAPANGDARPWSPASPRPSPCRLRGRAARRWSVRTRGVAIELEHLATYGLPGRSTSVGRERRRSPSSRRGTGDLLGDPLADVAVGAHVERHHFAGPDAPVELQPEDDLLAQL